MFEETEAHAGRLVRGRHLSHRLHKYFENMTAFIRNLDTIFSGIPVPPDNSVLEPLFHRQVKKCKDIAHDISI